MRYSILFFSLFLFSCVPNEPLSVLCPETCYTGPSDRKGIGQCITGTPTCNQYGRILTCEGDIWPELKETCDGIDNDCDGLTDELLEIAPYHFDNRCNQAGKCANTYEICNEFGEWECQWQNGSPSIDDTSCNGIDDNCDGNIDEDFASQSSQFCYSGPIETSTVGECRVGVEECILGEVICSGEKTPSNEVCDALDNDCNGIEDDVTQVYNGIDMILAVDVSGSMSFVHDALKNVICEYSESTNDTFRFGIVLIADPDNSYQLAIDLTDAAILCSSLELVTNGNLEPTLSAANAVIDIDNPLEISWREASKRIFVGFTDEPAQTIDCINLNSNCLQDEANLSPYLCRESDTSVYWFSATNEFYLEQAQACNGDLLWLSHSEHHLLVQMNEIISEVCLDELSGF